MELDALMLIVSDPTFVFITLVAALQPKFLTFILSYKLPSPQLLSFTKILPMNKKHLIVIKNLFLDISFVYLSHIVIEI